MKVLAIETSCDDTSVAIVVERNWSFEVENILSYSQIVHNKFWGVVPEIASRVHSEQIISVIEAIWYDHIKDVDKICVTTTPWLPGSLIVGKTVAKMLSEWFDKDIIDVNHVYGHIFAMFLDRNINDITLPALVLTVSGGHNDLYIVDKKDNNNIKPDCELIDKFEEFCGYNIFRIWKSLDDAAWEVFDKVSRMLGGPYPWGPWISKMAENWKANQKIEFPRIWLEHDKFDFSFSWTKSQVYNLLEKFKKEWIQIDEQIKCDIAKEFQESVVEVLSKKLVRAGIKFWIKNLIISGWVSCNNRRWEYLNEVSKNEKWIRNQIWEWEDINEKFEFNCYKPVKMLYSTDNAAMIWVVGIMEAQK